MNWGCLLVVWAFFLLLGVGRIERVNSPSSSFSVRCGFLYISYLRAESMNRFNNLILCLKVEN